MIRVLVMIAMAGFLLCAVSLGLAMAIGGPDAVVASAWNWGWSGGRHWRGDWDWDHHGRHHGRRADLGPEGTRQIAWSGGDSLEVEIPADITYTQSSGPAKVEVTGPQNLIDDIEIRDGRIRLDGGSWHFDRVTIAVTAPGVKRFEMDGSGRLDIRDYRQDTLSIDMSGSGNVVAKGQARDVDLDISGSGEADLGGLAAEAADVQISGSGEAIIAPKTRAKLDISGSGDVTLLTHPGQLETDVSGSGRVRQSASAASSSESPSPSPSASASPSPSPKKK